MRTMCTIYVPGLSIIIDLGSKHECKESLPKLVHRLGMKTALARLNVDGLLSRGQPLLSRPIQKVNYSNSQDGLRRGPSILIEY